MGYKNGQTGYPGAPLASRAVIKKNNYALIPPAGLVKNRVPGFDNCEMTILASRKLGASFVDYVVTMLPEGKNDLGFGGDGVETFVYVLDGRIRAGDGSRDYALERDGYLYLPPDKKLYLENRAGGNSELFLYKRLYQPLAGHQPRAFAGNAGEIKSYDYEGMKDVQIWDLLPTDDLGFDMNFHILSFERGASHGYIETHVQEHGALILEGEGIYNLDNEWLTVGKGDYIFMAAYTLQAAYGIGRSECFRYLYSKDCNRDESLKE
ncbi:MAG: (S)-ureidoglycine aminohydrolase [Candidatus Adiutrix sp.]|jgi:(S)-ureidoglycine aminohydrolase|nr:(S)-ureidoglycine aminohydrolase [Candidatus Adiutrix sp.]